MEKENIYQKLLKIQQHVESFVKNKKAFNFSYVDGNQVLNEIRPLMNSLGLLLKQEVIGLKNKRYDYTTAKGNAKTEVLSCVEMRFTWVDTITGEKDENYFAANGMNDFDKGVGSALTYGERYFLLKYFHIPTDADDVDAIKRDVPQETVRWKPKEPKPELKPENGKWQAAIDALKSGFSIEQIEAKYFLTLENRELLLTTAI